MSARLAAVPLALALAPACKPNLVGRASLIQSDTLIAVSSSPAEAAEKTSVTYAGLYVGPHGVADASSFDWALCDVRKPLTAPGSISGDCLRPAAKVLDPIGRGPTVTGQVPNGACRTFGPIAPNPVNGQTLSPADPDTTGGYYQPLRVLVPTPEGPSYTAVETRLDCGVLANATQDQSRTYAETHKPNQNPKIDALVLTHADGKTETVPPDETMPSISVKPGEATTFEASWSHCSGEAACGSECTGDAGADAGACPSDCMDPSECTGSESYLYLDPLEHTLVTRREAIRVSWFATDGDFDHDRTGQTEAEANDPKTDNPWTAPTDAGEVHVWVVIRDDRGGVGWSSYSIDVAP